MEYLDHFARFKRKENVEAVERLLSSHQELAKFERAQLGTYHSSLCVQSLVFLRSLNVAGHHIPHQHYILLTQNRLTLLRTR